MAKPYKRQYRNYLINRKYQLRYTLVMVLICMGLTAALGISWYNQMRVASEMVEVNALAAESETYAMDVRAELETYDRNRMLLLVGFGATLCVAIALFGILLTHKVAGPLRYFANILNNISTGNLGQLRKLRGGDFLEEFYESFRSAHQSLRDEAEQDLATLGKAIEGVEQALARDDESGARGLLASELEALREMRDRKVARLS